MEHWTFVIKTAGPPDKILDAMSGLLQKLNEGWEVVRVDATMDCLVYIVKKY